MAPHPTSFNARFVLRLHHGFLQPFNSKSDTPDESHFFEPAFRLLLPFYASGVKHIVSEKVQWQISIPIVWEENREYTEQWTEKNKTDMEIFSFNPSTPFDLY